MESGTKLAHYGIVSLLGKGGMEEVWRAKDMVLSDTSRADDIS